jgi:hypothetical protein
VSDWLDMTRYPNLDPDDAVTGARLSELREVLLGHGLSPLPDGAWHAALGAATGTAEPAHDPADDGMAGGLGRPDDGHLGSWWPEHQPDGGAGHPAPETRDVTDPHFGGDHW